MSVIPVVTAATVLTFTGYAAELTVPVCIGLFLRGFSCGFSPATPAAFAAEFFGQKTPP